MRYNTRVISSHLRNKYFNCAVSRVSSVVTRDSQHANLRFLLRRRVGGKKRARNRGRVLCVRILTGIRHFCSRRRRVAYLLTCRCRCAQRAPVALTRSFRATRYQRFYGRRLLWNSCVNSITRNAEEYECNRLGSHPVGSKLSLPASAIDGHRGGRLTRPSEKLRGCILKTRWKP